MIIADEIVNVKGKNVLFRNAKGEDAQILLDGLKATCSETRYLVKEPEETNLTIEQEKEFISYNNNSKSDMLLLGFLDGNYVGNCSIMGNHSLRYQHRVGMGIALYQKYTGMGIGRAMIDKLIDVARGHGFEQMELEVVIDNKQAIHLYESLGFEIYGTFPHNMKFKDGTYADVYWMMKQL